MGGDDQLAALVDGVDEPGQEVGERFADARAGLEEERLVVAQGRRDRRGHLCLLRPVLQVEGRAELSGFGENLLCQFAHPGRLQAGVHRRKTFFMQADHRASMSGVNSCVANEFAGQVDRRIF